jgi:hypothetical protein
MATEPGAGFTRQGALISRGEGCTGLVTEWLLFICSSNRALLGLQRICCLPEQCPALRQASPAALKAALHLNSVHLQYHLSL